MKWQWQPIHNTTQLKVYFKKLLKSNFATKRLKELSDSALRVVSGNSFQQLTCRQAKECARTLLLLCGLKIFSSPPLVQEFKNTSSVIKTMNNFIHCNKVTFKPPKLEGVSIEEK